MTVEANTARTPTLRRPAKNEINADEYGRVRGTLAADSPPAAKPLKVGG
jgi:hypothetical protein